MPNMQVRLALVLICALFSTAAAQDSTTAKTTLTITANATGDRVRVTAPSSVVQMHVEVYGASGEKLFDQEIRGGNVFDWHLQDGQAQRLAPGAYVCVVTAKSASGRISQKLGTVTVAEKSASVQAGSLQLSPQQAQVIGPMEADSSWTIAGDNEPQTPTVIANDGTDGQMIRGRGALTFRIGNFFSGIDTEQMRLSEAGDLGIGTSSPRAKLDVAGTVRAERFLVAKPSKTSNQAQSDDSAQATSDSVQPLVAGTGTQNRLAKWTDNAGTLGDSVITETAGGNIGIGTVSPGVALDVFTSGASTDLKVREASRTVDLSSNWSSGISAVGTLTNNKFGLAANGSIRLLLDPSGNVGIGTNSPGVTLDVVTAGAATDLQVREASRTVDISSNWTGGTSAIGTTTNNKFALAANGSIGLTLNTNGNVGIGTTTPADKLTVQTAKGLYGFTHLATDANGANPIALSTYVGSSASGATGAWFGTQTNHDLYFFTNGGQPKMTLSTTGNFGLGTSTPTSKLEIAAQDGLKINGFQPFLTLRDANSSRSSYIQGVNGDLAFIPHSFSGIAPALVIKDISGNVTIGMTDPNVGKPKLYVVGDKDGIRGETSLQSGIGVMGVNTDGGLAGYFAGQVQVDGDIDVFGGARISSIPLAAWSAHVCSNAAGDLLNCNFSSLRAKTNVKAFRDGLDIVRRLRPISYNWKENGLPGVGLGAEDVAEVAPSLVVMDTKGKPEGVQYDRLNMVLINAVKEQQDQLQRQQALIEQLHARLKRVERRTKRSR